MGRLFNGDDDGSVLAGTVNPLPSFPIPLEHSTDRMLPFPSIDEDFCFIQFPNANANLPQTPSQKLPESISPSYLGVLY